MFLDYTLKTPEERVEYVNKLTQSYTPSNKEKQYLADYILFINEKITKEEKKKEYSILSKNREATINKRQVSYEQIVSNLENGEDGIYALINNDRNQLLDAKDKITDEDIETYPVLKEMMLSIKFLEDELQRAKGKRKLQIKQQIIDTWKQMYTVRASLKGGSSKSKANAQAKAIAHTSIPEKIEVDENKNIVIKTKLSLLSPESVSFLLHFYSTLKQESWDDLHSDMHWLLMDLEDLAIEALKDEPILLTLLIWKVDGMTNEKIQENMEVTFGVVHNEQYYSTLWRKRIPRLIAVEAQKQWLVWHYSQEEYGEWKYCNKCGTYKLAHPAFFSKNTSADHFYSICKDCRKELNK